MPVSNDGSGLLAFFWVIFGVHSGCACEGLAEGLYSSTPLIRTGMLSNTNNVAPAIELAFDAESSLQAIFLSFPVFTVAVDAPARFQSQCSRTVQLSL